MSITTEQIYQLLPAIYRIRDAEQGEPLKALMTVLAQQAKVMEDDITRLHDNWFIETCDEWVIPYIGDLLGVRNLHPISDAPFSVRALVANTLVYRRRKGTAPVLEQLAFDTTGWRARAVEFFELLGWTQHYNHIRLHNVRTPDLRQTNQLELLNTAFDKAAHTVDVRHIASGRGWHNISHIGLFLWRLQSYAVTRGMARAATGAPAGRYRVSPLGYDMPLFNRPQTETEITHLAGEINVPGILRRRPLYDELEARRQVLVEGGTPEYLYFDDRTDSNAPPVVEIFLNGSLTPVSADEIEVCNLQDWHIPDNTKPYFKTEPDGSVVQVDRNIRVAVDPVLGRLTFSSLADLTKPPKVSYAYGFSGDVGGGPYNRRESVDAALTREVTWQVGISKEIVPVSGEDIFTTLADAVTEWHLQPAGTVGVIAILDSDTYEENLTGVNRIQIPEGSQLLIVAADWPEVDLPDGFPGAKHRVMGQLDPDDLRPHILGNIEIIGTAEPTSLTPGELVLNGLLIEGQLTVANGNLKQLDLTHCTLVPEKGGLLVALENDQLKVVLTRSICGPINLSVSSTPTLRVEESIVDGLGGDAIIASETAVEIEKATLLGKVVALSIEAGNSIFTDRLNVTRLQEGCVRFCYIPDGSMAPRRFRCQPDFALEEANATEHSMIKARLHPSFTSTKYGDAAYSQLGPTCAVEILTGAEDGSEMGIFCFLKQPQRITNLQTRLDEYLRFGLEAGIIFVT